MLLKSSFISARFSTKQSGDDDNEFIAKKDIKKIKKIEKRDKRRN